MALTVFSTWRLSRRLSLALGTFSLLLVLAAVAISLALRSANGSVNDETNRISPARVTAILLLKTLVDEETGLRGFALQRDESFLQPYSEGLVSERTIRARLEHLVPATEAAALTQLHSAVQTWHTDYAVKRLAGLRAGTDIVQIGFGKQLFDQIRSAADVLDRRLASDLRASQHRVDNAKRVIVVVLAVVVLVFLVALLLLQRALQSLVLAPLKDLGQQVEVVSKGTHLIAIEPSGPPDIREMGEGVESMRQELVGALKDVESVQADLERRAAELARSNADLEQFAYVASHDLQEPLRKVASFCQLLEQRYGGQLDERGEQYIAFAVDGAKRMQRLINDLLTFSRVGRSSEGFVPLDLELLVGRVWDGLSGRVDETGATLQQSGSERVLGDSALLQVLMTNLLGNALKYRRPDTPPVVHVGATEEDGMAVVTVADNGIGIPEEYADKVFVIFQRLHGRDEYEGTGIGLALCKRIVEFHGGTIGLRPSPLGGASVTFTLPLAQEETS